VVIFDDFLWYNIKIIFWIFMPEDKKDNSTNKGDLASATPTTLGGGTFVVNPKKEEPAKPVETKLHKKKEKHIKKEEKKPEKVETFSPSEPPPEEIKEEEGPLEGEVVDTFSKKEEAPEEEPASEKVSENIEGKDGTDGIEEEESQGIFSKISGFLAEIGIDSSSIFSSCIFIIFIAGIIYGLYWGYKRFFTGPETPSTEVVSEQNVQTPVDETKIIEQGNKTGISTSYIVGYEETSGRNEQIPQIGVSYIIGQNEFLFNTLTTAPIESAFILGFAGKEVEKDFVNWITILYEMKNAYETDIQKLLDQSHDRGNALDQYILELKRIDNDAKNALTKINETADILKINLNKATDDKKILEEDFFTSIDDLSGEKAEYVLSEFIKTAKLESEIKARYSALLRLQDMYKGFSEDFEKRIMELDANRDALIKGVVVFQVVDSKLEIIFPPWKEE
jgi:hypothetical protein